MTIEEPHMYNADDAIARVDSYIVSVGGGGGHVGERRLVRIESVAPLGGDRGAARRERRRRQGAGGERNNAAARS